MWTIGFTSFFLLVIIDPNGSNTIHVVLYLINNALIPIYSLLVFYHVIYSWYVRYFSRSKIKDTKTDVYDDSLDSLVSEERDEVIPDMTAPTTADVKLNLSGTFKLIKHEGFDEFLAANGVPYLMRRAVLSMQPIHTITHIDDTVRVQISGIISGDITYNINGPSVESTIHTRTFSDTVTYLNEGDGIQITKNATDSFNGGARQIIVTRRLVDDNKKMLLTSTSYFDDNRPPIQYTQLLERQ